MICLLIVEDDPAAAELTLHTLQSAGLACACERVETEREFREGLRREPDIILSDSNVPGFDGLAALSIARAECPTTPFIFVSGQTSEELARRAADTGATGYIAKSELKQLPSAVLSALQPTAVPLRRAADRPAPEWVSLASGVTHLLQRQSILDRTLHTHDDSSLSGLLSRTPPTPAALTLIHRASVRERYLKLLHNAHIETEVAPDATDARVRLTERVHALLFTDQLDLVRAARRLDAGSATHIVFVAPEDRAAASKALAAGANGVMPEEARGEQFWAHLTIARRIVSFAASLQSAVTDNRILSTIDELTRCGNRRYFDQQFPREAARAMRLRGPLALVLCDIDHFKTINDRHGHQMGDEVLRQFGDRLTDGLRLGQDWVARIGGEEFAIVLPETGRFRASAIAQRLRDRIQYSPFVTPSVPLKVTASFGVCGVQDPAGRSANLPEAMIAAADAALYQSKRTGRNRVTDAQ